jgi:hypothetical protein
VAADLPARGLTPREVARYYRRSPDAVRAAIARGELGAIVSRTRRGGVRYVVLPHHLREYEQAHRAAATPRPAPRRRRQAGVIDFYPDQPAGAATNAQDCD